MPGIIAGAHYTHQGSGANQLCMPMVPVYDEATPAADGPRALVYSAEYEIAGNDSPRIRNRHDHNPTCAVCRAPKGTTGSLMIPARNDCPSDEWRLEYKGYLMAEYYGHKRSQFICVDYSMEIEPGTGGNQDGALLYRSEVRCMVGGGLPCGPYLNGYELTCAVCTL